MHKVRNWFTFWHVKRTRVLWIIWGGRLKRHSRHTKQLSRVSRELEVVKLSFSITISMSLILPVQTFIRFCNLRIWVHFVILWWKTLRAFEHLGLSYCFVRCETNLPSVLSHTKNPHEIIIWSDQIGASSYYLKKKKKHWLKNANLKDWNYGMFWLYSDSLTSCLQLIKRH